MEPLKFQSELPSLVGSYFCKGLFVSVHSANFMNLPRNLIMWGLTSCRIGAAVCSGLALSRLTLHVLLFMLPSFCLLAYFRACAGFLLV